MAFKILRNDITKMHTDAVVNTANREPIVGSGCDYAVYKAAGYEELSAYRKKHIGYVEEGEVFITPGFMLPAAYIIHAVSPLFIDGNEGEEEKLRSCYRKSMELAVEKGLHSISFPLISTGSFGYPREEGMLIAVEEIRSFLKEQDLEVYLVVFDKGAYTLGRSYEPDLEAYIDQKYVREAFDEEYHLGDGVIPEREEIYRDSLRPLPLAEAKPVPESVPQVEKRSSSKRGQSVFGISLPKKNTGKQKTEAAESTAVSEMSVPASSPKKAGKTGMAGSIWKSPVPVTPSLQTPSEEEDLADVLQKKLADRMAHMTDTFSQYLMYLIREKQMENADVYKAAMVDKKIFSKIKNNPDYHPQKRTALCLSMGAHLNLDETKDLLARAGYALSPCDKTDIIFSFFIENQIYDMVELSIQLEDHGLPDIIG